MMKIPASMMLLTCGTCGHEDDLEVFCRTPIAGELPADTFQCPKCRKAWRMEKFEEGRWAEGGLWIPPGRRAVQIPTIL